MMPILKYAKAEDIEKVNGVLHAGQPTSCPCCDRVTKIYKRHLHHSTCRTLIDIYKLSAAYKQNLYSDHEWVHVSQLKIVSQDFHIAKHWFLIEQKPKEPDNKRKKTSGYWRITEKGRAFICGEISIPEWVHTYNKQVLGFTGDPVSMQDCLGEKFDYKQLMEG